MKTQDIKNMGAAMNAVHENTKAAALKALARSAAGSEKGKAAVTLPKSPWDKVKKEAMDPVDSKELKGKHKDRKDKDIDNDGDVDSSDEYLHKRRKAIGAAKKGQDLESQTESTLTGTIYQRILEKRDMHTKGATKPDTLKDDDTLPGKGAKEMEKDIAVTTAKETDQDEKGHDDAQKAGRAGPSAASDAHLKGATKGDKAIVNPVKGAVTR